MKYQEFLTKVSLSKPELLAFAWNALVEDPPAGGLPSLPAPPLLMFDRVVEVSHKGRHGHIVAEQDVLLDAWYFQCHFRNDPVQPGCLGVDAIWQLLGLYAALRGAKGSGRALGVREVEFMGQVRPYDRLVRYEIDIRRYTELRASGSALVIGSGKVYVDDEHIYTVSQAKTGIFKDIGYNDYPSRSQRSIGGRMQR